MVENWWLCLSHAVTWPVSQILLACTEDGLLVGFSGPSQGCTMNSHGCWKKGKGRVVFWFCFFVKSGFSPVTLKRWINQRQSRASPQSLSIPHARMRAIDWETGTQLRAWQNSLRLELKMTALEVTKDIVNTARAVSDGKLPLPGFWI